MGATSDLPTVGPSGSFPNVNRFRTGKTYRHFGGKTVIFHEKPVFSNEPSVKPDFYKLFPKLAALFTNFETPSCIFWEL